MAVVLSTVKANCVGRRKISCPTNISRSFLQGGNHYGGCMTDSDAMPDAHKSHLSSQLLDLRRY